MSDEMEIMDRFDKRFREWKADSFFNAGKAYMEFRKWVEPEFNRGICGVLEVVADEKYELTDNPEFVSRFCKIIQKHLDKYAPAPQYCEGMREMLRTDKPMNETAIYKYGEGKYFAHVEKGVRLMRDIRLKRCPFCEEGHNCIGGKA